jgi:predicted GH43/DUF377 family glycosyl hydrolase
VEDCRVSALGEDYYLTYTAVSDSGAGVGLRKTKDFKTYDAPVMILPPHNKDCAIFEEKINGKFYRLHRPGSKDLGGNYIWLAESPDYQNAKQLLGQCEGWCRRGTCQNGEGLAGNLSWG